MDFYPICSLDSSDTVSFVIPAIQKYMLDKVEILTDIRILTLTDGNPDANNNVSVAPHVAAALWRNVDVNVGGVSLVQSFDNSYGMFQFWETVIHNTEGCHDMLWLKEGLRLDSVTTKIDSESVVFFPTGNAAAANGGGKKRAERFAQGATVSLVSDLNVSIFKQDKLLPSNLEIHISMTKNYSEFILLSAAASTDKVVFDKVTLRCTFQKPIDMVVNIIEERLARENAIYHADNPLRTITICSIEFHNITYLWPLLGPKNNAKKISLPTLLLFALQHVTYMSQSAIWVLLINYVITLNWFIFFIKVILNFTQTFANFRFS